MALWTPANLTTAPVEWFKGDAGVTGNPVSAWTNQGTKGNLTQGTSTSRPSASNTLNSLTVLTFDGTSGTGDFLTSAATRTYTSGSLYAFVVANRVSTSASYDSIVWAGTGWTPSTGFAMQIDGDSLDTLRMFGGNGYGGNAPTAQSSTAVAAATDDKWHIFECGSDTAPNLAIDATTLTLGTNLTGSSYPGMTNGNFQIGTNNSDPTFDPFNGKIAEVIVLNYRPTATEISKIQGYLAWKWGNTGTSTTDLVSRLPSGHTYKSTAPTDSSSITGTVSITEAGDTATSTGKLAIKGTAAITEAGDTLSSNATLTTTSITGSVSVTEADDTVSSTGQLTRIASLTVTEVDDTVSSTTTQGRVANTLITEDDDTVVSTSTLSIKATANITEIGDTVSSTAIKLEGGRLTVTEDDDTVSATMNVIPFRFGEPKLGKPYTLGTNTDGRPYTISNQSRTPPYTVKG